MKKFILILVLLPQLLNAQIKHRTETVLLMDSRFEITPYAKTDSLVDLGINLAVEETTRLENLISEWKTDSEISEINRNAGIKPVKVSKEVFDLIRRCVKISDLPEGAFDITWACAKNVWKFDGSMKKLPSVEVTDSLKKLINYKNIVLNEENQTVFLSKKGMAIGTGGIGKGFAANRSKKILIDIGIQSGIFIAGGDLIAWGSPDENEVWKIGIANPNNPQTAIAWFEIKPMAVVTSGDYEHFVEFDGKRYSHIINPKTALPVENNLRSVTVLCPDAELADALATSVFVLGIDRGLFLINQLVGIECVIIDNSSKFFTSKGINLNYYSSEKNKNNHAFTIKN